MIKTIYLNLEDDVAKVINQVQRESTSEVVLVFPKQSFMFSDSINMRLLKKQMDMLRKKAYILTMDEKGQTFAQEAGFELKFLPRTRRPGAISDIRRAVRPPVIPKIPRAIPTAPVIPDPIKKPKAVLRKLVRKVTPVASPPVSVAPQAPKRQSVVVAPRMHRRESVQASDNVYIPPAKETLKVRPRYSYRKYIIAFVAVALIVALVVVLLVLPSATVNVYAKSQVVSRDIDIIADVSVKKIDASKLTIPASTVNETQNVTATFQTLGKKEVGSKAQGRVAIYNLTGSPLALKAGTTTLTVGSKTYTFTLDQQNVVPVSSATNDSNATVADIVAVEGGEGSNLPAGTRVEITNQAFGRQPDRLFAKTVSQVIGGASRFVSVISADDIEKAQNELTQKVVDDINEKLKAENKMIAEGGYTVDMTGFTTDKPENTESPSFSAQAQISITGLAFNEAELKQMIRQRLLLSLGSTKNLQADSEDKVSYKTKNIDTVNGVMQLSLHYESSAIPAIDPQQLKIEIAGKSKSEASELILANPDVDKTEIIVQPAWQSSLPRFAGKIKLELKEE